MNEDRVIGVVGALLAAALLVGLLLRAVLAEAAAGPLRVSGDRHEQRHHRHQQSENVHAASLDLGRAPYPGGAQASPVSGTGRAEGPAGGMASSYGPGLYGNPMACGGRLWRSTVAVAHRSFRCGQPLLVCYRRRCQRLLVRDRGPWIYSRSLDLTEAAVKRFGFRNAWTFGVRWISWEATQ